MKLSFASVAYATILALSATVADAATVVTSVVSSTAQAAPGTSSVVITITPDTAHAAVGDTFIVELPESFDAVLTEAAVVTSELTMTCDNGGSATAMVLPTDYSATYVAATRKLTLTVVNAAKKCLAATPLVLTFLKSTIRAELNPAASVKVQNSEVSAEITTPVTGPAAAGAAGTLVAALTGTLGNPSFVNDTFTIPYTPGAVVASGTVTVALHKYQFASDSVCSVGGTDAVTTDGTAIDGYDFVTFPSAFVAAEQEIKCTKVTRSTNETASKSGGVQVWTGDAKATFKDTAISTHSPTASPTAGPPVASGGACTVSVTTCVTNTTCTVTNATASATVGTCKAAATPTAAPTAAPVTPTAAHDHSSALSLSSAPLMLAALMVGLGSMN